MRAITQAEVLAAVGRVPRLAVKNPPTDYYRGFNDALDLAYRELLDALITPERTPA